MVVCYCYPYYVDMGKLDAAEHWEKIFIWPIMHLSSPHFKESWAGNQLSPIISAGFRCLTDFGSLENTIRYLQTFKYLHDFWNFMV